MRSLRPLLLFSFILSVGGALKKANQPGVEGQVRLVGGNSSSEGNVEIFHKGFWGSVCDDEWGQEDATVVCRQLSHPQGAIRFTADSNFGKAKGKFWLDNVKCSGHESNLTNCKSDGWGIHDCNSREAAGVVCHWATVNRPSDRPQNHPIPKTKISSSLNGTASLKVRITGGRTAEEGQVEIFLPQLQSFSVVCGESWSLREATVICRQLGMKFAQQATQSDFFGWTGQPLGLSEVFCSGTESRLEDCIAHVGEMARCGQKHSVAGVVCTSELPDLQLDLEVLQASVYLHDLGLYYLQCAMEENCAAPTAYQWRKEHDWYHKTRRLLRFSTKVHNIGDTDFRPFRNKQDWQWHQCHMHHHSMEVFSHYDILNPVTLARVAEGHKASFCLEDTDCDHGGVKTYNCKNLGDQGISVGCYDQYLHDIDCQWIDITELPAGQYRFRVSINPEYKVAEKNFTNNGVECDLHYNLMQVSASNCGYQSP